MTDVEEILAIFRASADIKLRFAAEYAPRISAAVDAITQALQNCGKLLIFGNGGSAADAQHIAAEFVNRYLQERHPLAAIALTTDSSVLTSISNDYGFDEIFAKQIRALGRKGDIAWGITTSGTSPNVVRAFRIAQEMGLVTIAFTGKNGGDVTGLTDFSFIVHAEVTPRIQETHLTLAHVICELVEKRMFQHG